MWLLAALFQRGTVVGCICGFKSRTRTHIITNGYVNAEEAHKGIFLRRPRACVHLFYGFTPCTTHYSATRAASHKRNENARPIKIHAAVYYLIAKTAAPEGNLHRWRASRLSVYSPWLWSVTVFVRAVYEPRALYSLVDLHVQLLPMR